MKWLLLILSCIRFKVMAGVVGNEQLLLSQLYRIRKGVISVKSVNKNTLICKKHNEMKWAVCVENLVCDGKLHIHQNDVIAIISPHLIIENNVDRCGSPIYIILASGVPENNIGSHKISTSTPTYHQLSMFNSNELLFYVVRPSQQVEGTFDRVEDFNGYVHLTFRQLL